uniref:Uncharacterized GPI-anchored protein At5g19230-like domain-containing protein n=1 Tax=Rhizophora mucronata TaxID=61149 RepID=A0A2P2N3Z2_RHIMU
MTTRAMASSRMYLFLPFFLFSIIFISGPVKCDDENDALLQGINNYRKSLKLSALTKNNNAECLAGEMADQFKDQPCTNTTGSNTVPGTEPQFSNYPSLLDHCHLNVSNTRDGVVMPACVPNPTASLVLANFTESQYSQYLNETKYTGAGISNDGDWVVVVLTTSTPEGSFITYNTAALSTKIGLIPYFLWSLTGFFIFLVN